MKGAAVALVAMAAGCAWAQADYPGALWNAAHSGNQTVANRPTSNPINYIVVHLMQGYYNGTISWFKNDASNVSAHYVIRSSDGQITQMVRNKDIAWHAGNWTYNQQSIGIEHEGFFDDPSWLTQAMYRSSADLVRWNALRYNIPRTRTRIIEHREVPGATTGCPGNNWNWTKFMEMVQHAATFASSTVPLAMEVGTVADVVVTLNNSGDIMWQNSGIGPVSLVTQNPPGRASAFSHAQTWLLPSQVGYAAFAASPGMAAEFRFKLRAPTTPGNYVESFQLFKESIGHFGPVMTFTINVPDPGIVVDNTSTAVKYGGTWQVGTVATDKFGADYRWANTSPTESAVASFFATGVPNRNYEVFAWWSQGTNRSTEAKFRLNDGVMKPRTVVVDQTANGGRWVRLGTVRMGFGGLRVDVSNQAPGGKVVIADAIRLVPTRLGL